MRDRPAVLDLRCSASGTTWTTILFVVVAIVMSQPSLADDTSYRKFKQARNWVSWIKSMQMPPAIRPVSASNRIFKRFTNKEWRLARIAVLLEQLTANCADLEYQGLPLDLAAANEVAHGPYWLSLGTGGNHQQRRTAERLQGEVDRAFTAHGQPLCAAMYEQLRRDGPLVRHFQRLTRRTKYRQVQVLWRARDICKDPAGFWFEPGIDHAHAGAACRAAEKHRSMWSD